jgi:hypothetical protein
MVYTTGVYDFGSLKFIHGHYFFIVLSPDVLNFRFCYMPPFNGKCEIPEQQMGRGVIVIGEKRSGHDEQKAALQGGTPKKDMRPDNLKIQMITQGEENAKVASNPKSYNTLPLCTRSKPWR